MATGDGNAATAAAGGVAPAAFRRVLVKLSGEALMGPRAGGLDPATVERIAHDLSAVIASGREVCCVVGGGNIFRGVSAAAESIDRATADSMGMLATVMNALALQSTLERLGVTTRVQSGLRMDAVCEPFIRRRAIRHMEKGRLVIFAAGTGSPFFTTDTAAALRASEMRCDALLKATKVDGVYSADPHKDAAAERYDRLSYQDVLTRDLRVMDATAVSLARENRIPILVLSILTPGGLARVLDGRGCCTIITGDG